MATLFRRLIHALRGSRVEADLREEMEAHRVFRQAQLEREGMAAAEAELESRRALGNVTLVQDDARDVWLVRWIDTLRQDVRNGMRMLARHPGVTATAVLSLALGIGANSAVFSLVNAVLLKPLPYRDPSRLVMIWAVPPGQAEQRNRATAPEYLAWQAHTTLFEGMGTQFQMARTLGADDNGSPAEVVFVQMLQPSVFEVLGVKPALGRPFRSDEEQLGAPAPVALLSDRLWEQRFGRDPGIINRVIRVNGTPTTVVGVMPPAFSYLSEGRIDLYVPFAFNPPQLRGSAHAFTVSARLKPGVTVAQAQAEIDAVVKQVEGQLPPASKGWGARVQPLQEAAVGDLRPALMLLQGVVGFVLLIACGNVAGLLLARSSSRHTEIAVRAAIGAGRARIVRQLLTESVVLTTVGGLAGLAVAWALLRILVTMSASWLPGLPEAAIDGPVLVFTMVLSVVTGLVFGSIPSFRGSRPDLVASLKSSAKGTASGSGRHGLRSGLVVAQIALACVLLVGSGLLVSSFVRLKASDLGGDPDGVVRLTVPFSGDRFLRQSSSYKGFPLLDVNSVVGQTIDRVLDRIQGLPDVQSVAGSSIAPFTGAGPLVAFDIHGRAVPGSESERQAFSATYQLVTPHFFTTMKMPLLRGRDFDRRDTPNGPWGIVINNAMAERFWPSEDPIGQRLTLDLTPDEQPREIVGVVTNVRSSPYDQEVRPAMYVLHSQQPPHTRGPAGTLMRNRMSFVIRANGDPAPLVKDIRAAMIVLDREIPIADVQLVNDDVAAVLRPSQHAMTVVGLFAGVALLLAAVGLYGVMSHAVGQRTREIGIRMALGADRADVLSLIMRRVVVLIVVGLAAGIAGAVLLARLMSKVIDPVLWGVESTDVPTYLAVAVVMAAVALLAALIPAHRAVRVAPTVALRSE